MDTQSGAVFMQQDVFKLGVMDGLLYIIAEDWCTAKLIESRFTQIKPDCWYMLALAYDGSAMSLYLNGEKTYTFPCKPSATGKAAKSEFVIGDMLDAYFKDFMLFNKALTDEAIRKLASKISTKAFARLVSVHPVREFRFRVNGEYEHIERMVGDLLEESETVSFTGGIGSIRNETGRSSSEQIRTVSTPSMYPYMCNLAVLSKFNS